MGGKGPLKKLIDFFKLVKCYSRIAGNFYKCFIFYLLDIVKYLILFLPILGYSIITKTSVVKNTKTVAHFLRWSDKTLYQCYLCKKKKQSGRNMSFWKKLKEEAFGKGKNFSSHAFFYFFLVIIALVSAVSFFAMLYSPNVSDNKNP